MELPEDKIAQRVDAALVELENARVQIEAQQQQLADESGLLLERWRLLLEALQDPPEDDERDRVHPALCCIII